MRKFLPYIFIFIVLFGIFIPSGVVFGQTVTNYQWCMYVQNNEALCSGNNNPYGNPTADSGKVIDPKAEANQKPSEGNVVTDYAFGKITGWVLEGLVGITQLIMTLMSLVLWLSGTLLNLIIDYTIIHLKENLANMTGINIAWRVIRDLVNISFIFILVYEGIKMIISQSDIGKAKQVIVGVIVTSILINFSVFFTKVIIDASNVVTIGFYKSINEASTKETVTWTDNLVKNGISGAFVNALQISKYFDINNIKKVSNNDKTNLIILSLFGSLLFLILAFIFFAIAIMFFVRYVAFIILLILSPIGFLGWGIPKLQGQQKKWWDTLIGQALFAPVYMISTWVVLVLIYSPGFIVPTGGWGDMLLGKGDGKPDPEAVSILINFGIIIALAIFTLTQAKSLASRGAGEIAKVTGMITSRAGGALMGAGAMAGRNTVGRLANRWANDENLKDKASQSGFGGWAARQRLKAYDRTAKGTFDARNTSTVGWATGQLGMDIGKGGKSNFRTVLDDKGKKEAEFAKKLKPNEETLQKGKDAKKTAEELRKKEKDIKDEINKDEFKKAEDNRKKEHLESDGYKNSDIYKKAEEEKKNNDEKIKAENEKTEQLRKELAENEKDTKSATYLTDPQKRVEIDSKLNAKREEFENQKKKLEETKKEIEKNTANIDARKKYEDGWKSDILKQKETEMNNFATNAKENEDESDRIKNLHTERTKAYAKTIEEPGFLGKTANAVATLALGNRTTKSDRKVIGRKIRAVATEKTPEQIITEAAIKERAARKKKLKEAGEPIPDELKDDSDKEPETPSATPTPTK